ncbi:hypothetical protein BD410DRAFT_843117 [Rickenella mellea]|uniref:F-box domain-containing protein n=1 Tax=Rickenella mellea TaxID=50990 RepID=A0A4Y7PU80_9AGAM|nr:hypothetical protein BD410DRAFT_843117 [Rickenella mellea]
MSLDHLLTCLIHCPLLEELAFPINKSTYSHTQELPPLIKLSRLRHFSLSLGEGINPGYLIDVLFLPALISLEVFMDLDIDHCADWPHLRPMLARSRPPLQTLCLWSVPIAGWTLRECLSYIPSLILLQLDGICSNDTFLEILTVDEDDPSGNVCSCLETIKFASASRCSPSAMVKMILSRRKSAKSTDITTRRALEHLYIGFFDLDGILSNPEIAECVADGLQLTDCS